MDNIGKYRIEEKIGSGGFGEVFRGHDPFIKRHVAVKTCSSTDPEIKDRFFREAEIAGNLHHRNVTTVYDFGVHEGLPYLIQEYLSGEDLDVKIKRRDFLPYPEKLYYLLQIARGLAYAHSKGIIHRDVKPSNIRILEDGTAKIMDFGIARLAQQESGLTKTGMTVGTAAYLSPEQVRGAAVDLRTDVFSFGVLAYELLTGERPFQGEQISTVIYQLLNHEPKSIADLWPAAPAEMVAIIERCLRKEAGERFADGSELVRELEALQKRGATAAATPAVGDRQPENAASPAAHVPATPVPAAPVPAAHDLEYSLPSAAPLTTRSAVARVAAKPRFSTAGTLVILLLLAAVAAGAGWWVGMRDERPWPASPAMESAPATVAGQPADAATPALAAPLETGSPPEGTPLETQTPEAQTPPEASGGDAGPGAEEAAPPPPPAPPAPTTGRIEVLAVTWTDQMTVSLAGKTYRLWRGYDLELPAGRYEAVFSLSTDAYSPAERRTTVVVEAGSRQQLAAPIPPAGELSVRPMIGRPQGQVFLDGEPMGSILSKVQREPGEHSVEIRPLTGGEEALKETVVLEPDREVILSFDLTAGEVISRTKELSP